MNSNGVITLILITPLFLFGCVATTDNYDNIKPVYLKPYGPHAESKPLVRYVDEGSPLEEKVNVGDEVIAVDGTPVGNTYNFYQLLNNNIKEVKFKSQAGDFYNLSFEDLVKPNSYMMNFWLFKPGQTLAFDLNNPAYLEEQHGALLYPKNSIALVAASIWPTTPGYLEIYLELRVNKNCADCKLENIAVLDLGRNSWLSPVTPDHVAWALYPESGRAPNLVSVPPPTQIGSTTVGSASGTFNAHQQGNYVSGNYTASGMSSTSYYHDYTMTNIALAHNLGAMIAQTRIRHHNIARRRFVERRQSNLRIGKLNPGERVTGYVQFQLPAGFDGPYLVVLKSDNIAVARFDKPE